MLVYFLILRGVFSPIPYLSYGSAIGIFDGGGSWNTDCTVKFISGRQAKDFACFFICTNP
jgi:hypothetical protein